MSATAIEWATHVLNAFTGCDRKSPGCANCYALSYAARLKAMGKVKYQNDGGRASGPGFGFTVHQELLDKPPRFPAGARVFVNSMSDVFHEEAPLEAIVEMWAIFAEQPQANFLVLTKRAERMQAVLSHEDFPHQLAKALDRRMVRAAIAAMGPEQVVPIDGYPGYLVTDRGRVLRQGASDTCVWCGDSLPEERSARSKFCSQLCNSKAHYEESQGRWAPPTDVAREMRPVPGEQGHLRVQLIGPNGRPRRELVHRLVLTAFERPPASGEQGCHRDGDPSNNALPNLRWGSQSDNWSDRIRHGNHRTHRTRKEANSWIKPDLGFEWPLPNCWAGVSIENRRFVHRARLLAETPAAVRFVSAEPLLGPLIPEATIVSASGTPDGEWSASTEYQWRDAYAGPGLRFYEDGRRAFDWLIAGGESGPGFRRMDLDWVRDLRDACVHEGVAFFFKQVGGRTPKAGGRELDGRTWDELPASHLTDPYNEGRARARASIN